MSDELHLDDQLCFALYAAARAATNGYRAALAELGLTYTQYVVLLALWERDGMTVTALGDRLRLDSGTLSPLLRRLQTLGLVERRRDDADERRVTVHLTEAAWDLQPRVARMRGEIHAAVPMTDEELSTLRALAHRFCDAVDSADPPGSSSC